MNRTQIAHTGPAAQRQ